MNECSLVVVREGADRQEQARAYRSVAPGQGIKGSSCDRIARPLRRLCLRSMELTAIRAARRWPQKEKKNQLEGALWRRSRLMAMLALSSKPTSNTRALSCIHSMTMMMVAMEP